jgi:HSP20 family protein
MVESTHLSRLWPALYEPFRTMGQRIADLVAPAAEASGDAGAYRITVELPGVAEEDIHLEVHDNVVTLQGEKRTEREEKGETFYFTERSYGEFSRSFRLPPDADGAKVEAELKDGVLTVTIPKHPPAAEGPPHRVEIRRG